MWLLCGSKRVVNSSYYITSLGDVLPQLSGFFMGDSAIRDIGATNEPQRSKCNLENINLPIDIYNFDSIILFPDIAFHSVVQNFRLLLDFIPLIEERAHITFLNNFNCNCVLCLICLICVFFVSDLSYGYFTYQSYLDISNNLCI